LRFASSIVEGESAETRFLIDYLMAHGRPKTIEFANAYQNMREHWDIAIDSEKIDVKGQRRLSRSGGFSEDFAIFEMLNVNGDTGWGYGKADIIAYEFSAEWILIERPVLADFVFGKVDMSVFLNVFDGPLKAYRRKGRKDSYTWIPRHELEGIHINKIKKQANVF
jgi:hypothetical protein